MFYFVVRYLRWLRHVPGLPHLFDALLLSGTCIFYRSRLAAMDRLEAGALHLPGVQPKVHRFGGTEFVDDQGRELGHVHGNGLVDVAVGNDSTKRLLQEGRVRPHHVYPNSKWISFQIESSADVPFALELMGLAHARLRARQPFACHGGKSIGPSVTS